VGPRASLEILERRKDFVPNGDSNHETSVVHHVLTGLPKDGIVLGTSLHYVLDNDDPFEQW
jgi:hypothetical protein